MTARSYLDQLEREPLPDYFTFSRSISITGNDGKLLVPDMEIRVQVSRRYNGEWVVDRVWETYWNADDVELLAGGDSHAETGIYHDICNQIEANQADIDARYGEQL